MRTLTPVLALALLDALPLVAQQPSPLSVFLTTTGVYDSNVDHDATEQPAYGGAVGLGLSYEQSGRVHAVEAQYEVAGHRYSGSDRWNRVSQLFEGSYALRPVRWFRVRLGVEASLKGNSEDRDLGNEYAFKPRLELRPAAGTAIRVTAATRLKQDAQEPDKNATNQYLALDLRQRYPAGGELTLGVRREFNRARSPDSRYRRTLYSLGLSSPPEAQDVLTFEVDFRDQRYLYRLADRDVADVLRRDRRVTAGLAYTHRFGPAMEVTLGYEFEARGSNDPEKEYVAHLMSLAVRRSW